jgi:hypothetical protein
MSVIAIVFLFLITYGLIGFIIWLICFDDIVNYLSNELLPIVPAMIIVLLILILFWPAAFFGSGPDDRY